MKLLSTILFTLLSLVCLGQSKYAFTQFNQLMEVEGTSYVIANIENKNKIENVESRYLLFIDTKTGATTQVDFPNKGYLETVEQVKIDELGINKIIVVARTIDLDGKKGIGWSDPKQILILSPDGKEKTQLTDSKLFVRTWTINKTTGTLVVTGHFDSNDNGKYDKSDKNEIGIYDLQTLQLLSKI